MHMNRPVNNLQEIEAKFYVKNLARIEARLRDMKAHVIQPRILETNIRFDLPGGALRSQGQVLRLRRDAEARLTYKAESVNDRGVLKRTEIEFAVEDFEKAKQVLEALGYRKSFYYEKYRTTYAVQTSEVLREPGGPVHVMLDELPYGNFVEIEGGSVEQIRDAADRLRLKWDAAVPASYHVLFDRLCARHPNLDATDLSFTALRETKVTAADLSVRAADDDEAG
jgi:adenylate cyclase class 2